MAPPLELDLDLESSSSYGISSFLPLQVKLFDFDLNFN